MVKKLVCSVIVAALAVLLMASPAAADEPTPDYLDELQRIAGQAVTYEPVDTDGLRALALDPFTCTLYPSVVHFRTSSGRRSVGAKPYTRCTTGTPTTISQTSTLYIVEWAGAVYKPMVTRTATSRGVRNLDQKNVEWFCANGNSSRFQQETKGYSIQAGRTYQSAVLTARVDLSCGY
jgi:hypothetical protein